MSRCQDSRFLKFWYIIDPAWNSKPATSQSLLRRTGEDKLSSDDFFSLVNNNKWAGLPREVPFVNRVSKYVRKVDCHDCLHAEKSPSFCSGSRHHFSYRQYTAPKPPRRALRGAFASYIGLRRTGNIRYLSHSLSYSMLSAYLSTAYYWDWVLTKHPLTRKTKIVFITSTTLSQGPFY